MDIYGRIKELAQQRKISIRQLEHDLSFANGTIGRWHTSAPIDKLTLVANYFSVTVEYLISGDKPAKPAPKRVDLEQQLDDKYTIMAYGGRELTEQELEMIKRLLDR